MKLAMKITAFLVVAVCYTQLTSCVPISSKNVDETKKSEEPCDLEELENIPKCEVDDKDCDATNVQKRAKRQTLCAKNPNCSYCGMLIPGDLTDTEEEPLVVVPEIVEPTVLKSGNSTDEIREPPRKLIERNIIIENDNETQYYRGYIESGANITTVIRLTNLIKNENIINMPTTLNNTNINNIHIYQNKTSDEGGKFGLGFDEKGSCCFAVEPKNCKQSTSGTKCRHKKYKVCGRQCTSKIIHPKKNSCTYTQQWPYVVCPNNQQPGFYPPSNMPGFYPPPNNNPGFYPPGYPGFYPQNPPTLDEFDDDEDLPLFPDDDTLENPEEGWIVGPEKCKIVSEDGLQIFNCTNKGVEFEHPYARNTVSESIKRETRHTNHQQGETVQKKMMQQQMMPYYPVMYQPVVMYQPMPVYLPQYYAQPSPMNYYQPQQIPQPPIDNRDSYFENDETNEINSYQKSRKHSRKHHPVVMDIEEEL
jgi:hypothetical protein